MTRLDKWFGFSQDEIFDEGVAAFDRGDFEESIRSFDACLESDPEPKTFRLLQIYRAEALGHLGHRAFLERRPLEALRLFESALRGQADLCELNLVAARACRELRAPQRAKAYVANVRALRPHLPQCLLLEAQLLLDDRSFGDAVAVLKEIQNVDSDLDSLVLLETRQALEKLDAARAEELLDCLVAMVSGEAAFRLEMAECLMQEGHYSEAVQAYRRVQDIAALPPEVETKLEAAVRASGHPTEASMPRFVPGV